MKPTSSPKPSTSKVSLIILLPLILFIFVTLIVYPNESKSQVTTSDCTTLVDPHVHFIEQVRVKPDFRLFIGVLTVPGNYERRNLIRLAYAIQPNHTAHIDVKFVFCNVTKEEDIVLVALEIIRYEDIIILDCAENMDGGKTYTYFSSLPKIFEGEFNSIILAL